jgi:hypothetical protein
VVARRVGDGEPGDQDERDRDRERQQDGEHQRDGGPGPRRGGQGVQQAILGRPGRARRPRLPGRRPADQNGNRQTPNASPNMPWKFVPSFHR